MGLCIKDAIKKTFTNDVVKQVAGHVGESEARVERGIAAAVPSILQNMSAAAETDEGLHALQTELDKADVDLLDSFGRRFTETPNIIVERGRSLMKNLFGAEEAKSTATRVASAAGIGNVSAEMVTGAVVPVVTGALAKHRKTAGLSVAGMRSALATQFKETSAAGAAASFPPGEVPVGETPSWTALLFPLLALVGLIVLGISLAGDSRSKSKEIVNGEQLASNTAGAAEPHGTSEGGSEADGDAMAAGNTSPDAKVAGKGASSKEASSKGASSDSADVFVSGDSGDGEGKSSAGHGGDDSSKASKETTQGDSHAGSNSDGHASSDGHGDTATDDVADAGSKASAAAGAVKLDGVGADVAVELPAAVSKATRILNAVEDVAGARNAIPKLDDVTGRIAKLRGDQKAWPDATQSIVRRRLFALMPALNDAVGKMLEKDEYLITLEKPLTKFIGEIDLLVPER